MGDEVGKEVGEDALVGYDVGEDKGKAVGNGEGAGVGEAVGAKIPVFSSVQLPAVTRLSRRVELVTQSSKASIITQGHAFSRCDAATLLCDCATATGRWSKACVQLVLQIGGLCGARVL